MPRMTIEDVKTLRDERERLANAWTAQAEEMATLVRENGELLQTLGRKDKEIAALKADNAALLGHLEGVRNELDDMAGVRAGGKLRAIIAEPHPGASLLSEMDGLKAEIRALALALKGEIGVTGNGCLCHDGYRCVSHKSADALALPEAQRQLAQAEADDA